MRSSNRRPVRARPFGKRRHFRRPPATFLIRRGFLCAKESSDQKYNRVNRGRHIRSIRQKIEFLQVNDPNHSRGRLSFWSRSFEIVADHSALRVPSLHGFPTHAPRYERHIANVDFRSTQSHETSFGKSILKSAPSPNGGSTSRANSNVHQSHLTFRAHETKSR